MIKLYDPVTDLKYSKFALIFWTYFKYFKNLPAFPACKNHAKIILKLRYAPNFFLSMYTLPQNKHAEIAAQAVLEDIFL